MSGRRIEIEDGPDRQGRYSYVLFWTAEYMYADGVYRMGERAQHYHAKLPEWAKAGAA